MTRRSCATRRALAAVSLLAATVGMGAGCAPAGFTDGITYAARQHEVRDASASPVRGMGHLRFDTALRSDLDDALAVRELAPARQSAESVLRRANQLALDSVHNELQRMPPDGLHWLAQQYDAGEVNDPDTNHLRAALQKRFDEQSRIALERDLARVAQADTSRQLRDFLSQVRSRIEPEAGDAGRLGRALLTAPMYVPAAIGAEIADTEATRRSVIAEFDEARLYGPTAANDTPTMHALEGANTDDLVRWLAPVFVQEVAASADYPPSEDRIGRVYLTGSASDVQVHIDVDDPVVYWKRTQARIRDQRYDQLVYVAWYPGRPALSAGDPQAGRIDGVVVRVTLDRYHRPAVYEFVRTCGCYHTLWVADFVEQAALSEFGSKLPDMAYAVQKQPEHNRELFMPALVKDDGLELHRPTVMVNAGQHFIVTIDTDETGHFKQTAHPRTTYRLEPYDVLTRLPLDDGVASMFNGEGLVHGAARAEGWMLAPTGMLQAGRPRQLGTMKIRMDAYDYDDPRLLERNLRLPSGF